MALYFISCSHQRSHWTNEGCLEYTKRISKFEDIHHLELKRRSYASKVSPKEIQVQETKRILSLIPKQSLTLICDHHGKQTDSLGFSQQLLDHQLKSPNITWIIGPAYGLDMKQLQSYEKISLSNLTFPHEMAKLILLEQIYRALTIQHNHPYHL